MLVHVSVNVKCSVLRPLVRRSLAFSRTEPEKMYVSGIYFHINVVATFVKATVISNVCKTDEVSGISLQRHANAATSYSTGHLVAVAAPVCGPPPQESQLYTRSLEEQRERDRGTALKQQPTESWCGAVSAVARSRTAMEIDLASALWRRDAVLRSVGRSRADDDDDDLGAIRIRWTSSARRLERVFVSDPHFHETPSHRTETPCAAFSQRRPERRLLYRVLIAARLI